MKKLVLLVPVIAWLVVSNVLAATIWKANLTSDQETPPLDTPGGGLAVLVLNRSETLLTVIVSAYDIESEITASHIHRAPRGQPGPIVFPMTESDFENPVVRNWQIPRDMVEALFNGELYVNIHSNAHPGGEIRGQIVPYDQ